MPESFEFVADGRTFNCCVESSTATRGEAWWWFTVTGDGQRYAAFRPLDGESRSTVEQRIAKFYSDRLERLAAPPVKRWSRGGPPPAKEEADKGAEEKPGQQTS